MAQDFDIPPLYDVAVNRTTNQMADIWIEWFSTSYQTLISYLSQTGIFLPLLASSDRDAIKNPMNGQVIFNTTLAAPQCFINGVWKTFTLT